MILCKNANLRLKDEAVCSPNKEYISRSFPIEEIVLKIGYQVVGRVS